MEAYSHTDKGRFFIGECSDGGIQSQRRNLFVGERSDGGDSLVQLVPKQADSLCDLTERQLQQHSGAAPDTHTYNALSAC